MWGPSGHELFEIMTKTTLSLSSTVDLGNQSSNVEGMKALFARTTAISMTKWWHGILQRFIYVRFYYMLLQEVERVRDSYYSLLFLLRLCWELYKVRQDHLE